MIYLVEDDESIRELVVYTLNSQGLDAQGFERPSLFWKAKEKEQPPLVLLDIMLPGEDGYSILESLKSSRDTRGIPVIMVTAKEAEYDKVKGLEAGADDYITKPFGMMEFVARVKAVLRRCSKQEDDKELRYGDLSLSVGKHKVHWKDTSVELTRKEFELLQYLMEN